MVLGLDFRLCKTCRNRVEWGMSLATQSRTRKQLVNTMHHLILCTQWQHPVFVDFFFIDQAIPFPQATNKCTYTWVSYKNLFKNSLHIALPCLEQCEFSQNFDKWNKLNNSDRHKKMSPNNLFPSILFFKLQSWLANTEHQTEFLFCWDSEYHHTFHCNNSPFTIVWYQAKIIWHFGEFNNCF